MKKVLLIAVFCSLYQLSIAQSLLKVGITYTIGKEQSWLGQKKDANHTKNVNSSFGGGLSIDLGYAYVGDNNFGPEATFTFFLGKPKTISHIQTANSDNKTVIDRKMLFFSPSLIIIGTTDNDVNPYLSSGLLFNLWQNVTKTEYITKNETEVTEKKWKVDYNIGIGYKSKAGVLYELNDDLFGFAELQYQMISIAYKKETLEEYTVNNQDLLSTLSLGEKEKVYKDELNHESNTPTLDKYDKNKSTDLPLKYANYNHFGASVGAFFLLNN